MPGTDKPDAQWIRQALTRYEGPLLRYALRIVGNVEAARDVVQDTFVRLCRADQATVEDHLAQWLFTVCRNRAFELLRKEGRMNPLTDDVAVQESDQPDALATAAAQDDLSAVMQVVETLPARQQELIRLKFQNGLSYKEISQVTRLTVSNVGYLLHTAIRSVRRQLEAMDVC